MIIIDDPEIDDALPRDYGRNDFPLIVQDRSFDRSGRMSYDLGMMDRMQGFHGGEILVNGAIRPKLTVPAGLVRLQVLNASNARVYDFRFSDGRQFHQVASDGGLLPAPVAIDSLHLAPAERAEIVVDFSDRKTVRLVSRDLGSGGMMGGGMGMMGGPQSYAMATFDTNKDGTLSPEEMIASTQAELTTYDTDANGTLSLDEFGVMHAAHTRPITVRAFQMHDADGDAQVTDAEMGAMAAMMQDHMGGERGGMHGMGQGIMGNN